jgi:hypothetical protein
LHAAAAEQLEGLYEARLALEGERLAQLAAAKDDVELSLKVGSNDQRRVAVHVSGQACGAAQCCCRRHSSTRCPSQG